MIFNTAHTPYPLYNQNNNLYTPAALTRDVHLYMINNCTADAFPSVQQQFASLLCPYNPCSSPPEYKSSR